MDNYNCDTLLNKEKIEKCHSYNDCIYKDTNICHQCNREPGWEARSDCFQSYEPACPIGMIDCVCDPAYIKHFNPEWYEDLYGNMTVVEVVEKCCKPYIMDGHWCTAYDDEDK